MTHDEMILVIKAHRDGKAIDVRDLSVTGAHWCRACSPAWNFSLYEYRINPEPRVVECWILPSVFDGKVCTAYRMPSIGQVKVRITEIIND